VKSLALFTLLFVCACQPSVLGPTAFYSLRTASASYPVMLSRTHASEPGRPVQVAVEEEFGDSSNSHRIGSVMIMEHSQWGQQSSLDADSQIERQMKDGDRWIEVDGITYLADDESGWSSGYAKRSLKINARVQQ
jgi:hypothetical protein